MDIKKLTVTIRSLGVLLILAALVWWYHFYGALASELNADLYEALPCLTSSSGGCGLASGIASFAGATPYNPQLFWVGVVLFIVGLVMSYSLKKDTNTQ
jgi:hypothetical protein